jgi:hypothetical protein
VLAFEALAPLWFLIPPARPVALVIGLGMHATIGLAFGPVIWFSLLMIFLLLTGFAPLGWLEAALRVKSAP